MVKFIKIIAVILLIGGIIGSLVNIEYALTGIFTSVAAFTLLYGFGMILGSVQRMEQSLSSLAEILRRKERESVREGISNKPVGKSGFAPEPAASSTSPSPTRYWRCSKCGYQNVDAPGSVFCKSCNALRGK